MTEYEMLDEICQKIGYNAQFEEEMGNLDYSFGKSLPKCIKFIRDKNVREMLFTQEFIDKLIEYMSEKEILTSSIEEHNIYYNLMKNNLNKPTQYLYNLLGLGQKN